MTLELTPIPGGLLSVAEAKAYLSIASSITAFDDLLTSIIAAVEADIAAEVGRLVTAAEVAEVVTVGKNVKGFGVTNWPIDSSGPISVADPDGTDVTDSFDVDYATGRFRAGSIISRGTYTVTYTGGMSAAVTWARDAAVLKGDARDWVAELFTNRNPGASSVKDGDEVVSSADGDMPPRIKRRLARFRGW